MSPFLQTTIKSNVRQDGISKLPSAGGIEAFHTEEQITVTPMSKTSSEDGDAATACTSRAQSNAKLIDGTIIHEWNGPNDTENPFNWSKGYRWFVTILVCFYSVLTNIPAGAYDAGNNQMSTLFDVSVDNLAWGTTSWNLGAAFWPLLFVPFTESIGRTPVYLAAFVILTLSLFPSAFAQNFATLVITRFFGGGASNVFTTIVGGSIADVWREDRARSRPMSLFVFTATVGIALGPFVGAAIVQIAQPNSWRWVYYIQLVYNGALIPVLCFLLKETRGDVILSKRAKKLRKETRQPIYAQAELSKDSIVQILGNSFQRPVNMLLTEPVVTFFTLWVSFAWGILFLFFSSITQCFTAAYGFNVFQNGLVVLALSAGALIGIGVDQIQIALYRQSACRNTERPGKPIPEARLYSALPGSLIFTAGLFMFGWTVRSDVHYIVPCVAVAMVGMGIYSIYLGAVNYLADAYERFAASALSAATLGMNVFAAFLPLASDSLFSNLGFGWAGSLLGFVGLMLSLVPVVLLFKGKTIRMKSPFMAVAAYDDDEQEQRMIEWATSSA